MKYPDISRYFMIFHDISRYIMIFWTQNLQISIYQIVIYVSFVSKISRYIINIPKMYLDIPWYMWYIVIYRVILRYIVIYHHFHIIWYITKYHKMIYHDIFNKMLDVYVDISYKMIFLNISFCVIYHRFVWYIDDISAI